MFTCAIVECIDFSEVYTDQYSTGRGLTGYEFASPILGFRYPSDFCFWFLDPVLTGG